MIGIRNSCDPERLRKVLVASRSVMKGFYGLTPEDKEDILIDVMYRFEVDKGRFPVSVYARHCRNKVIGFLGKKTAQKRMAQKKVDGVTVYFQDVSLNARIGEEEDAEFGDFIPVDSDFSIDEVELMADIERKTPDLAPLVRRVLQGDTITRQEKRKLREGLTIDIVGARKVKI